MTKQHHVMHILLFIFSLLVFGPRYLYAHPGGLDSSGCHHNRKTGDYHCHRGGSSSEGSYEAEDLRLPQGKSLANEPSKTLGLLE